MNKQELKRMINVQDRIVNSLYEQLKTQQEYLDKLWRQFHEVCKTTNDKLVS